MQIANCKASDGAFPLIYYCIMCKEKGIRRRHSIQVVLSLQGPSLRYDVGTLEENIIAMKILHVFAKLSYNLRCPKLEI